MKKYIYELITYNRKSEFDSLIENSDLIPSGFFEIKHGFYMSIEDAELILKNNAKFKFGQIIKYEIGKQKWLDNNIKMYSYLNGERFDESLCPISDTSKFKGRESNQIKHNKGDIVLWVDDYDVYWGKIYETPPLKSDGLKNMDYFDDSYVILANDKEYIYSHEHILSVNIFKPDCKIPDYVKKIFENV